MKKPVPKLRKYIYLCALCLVFQKRRDLLWTPVVGADHETVVVHIQDQVLTHYGQTYHPNVSPERER